MLLRIDMSTRKELIAAAQSVEEIRDFVGADSLSYLSLEGLVAATQAPAGAFCRACFDGEYPIPVGDEEPRSSRSKRCDARRRLGPRGRGNRGMQAPGPIAQLEWISRPRPEAVEMIREGGSQRPRTTGGARVGGFAA